MYSCAVYLWCLKFSLLDILGELSAIGKGVLGKVFEKEQEFQMHL